MNFSEFRRRIFDRYYETHFRQVASNRVDERTFRRKAVGYRWNYGGYISSLPDGAQALDLGCGLGQCLYWLHEEGLQCTGIDLSAEQLEQARTMLPESVRLEERGALDFLSSSPDIFGVIVANDLLEHLTRPEALEMVDAAFEALRPGGLLIARVPNAICPGAGRFFNDLTHERPYTGDSMRHLLRLAGFTDVDVFAFEPHPFRSVISPLGWACRHAMWSLYRLRLYLHHVAPGPEVVSRNLAAAARKPEDEDRDDAEA